MPRQSRKPIVQSDAACRGTGQSREREIRLGEAEKQETISRASRAAL